mmetsp:Transcript_55841/g.147625  ORF Transcript_55841/g.147625 Transcript_55841/m.147625 type:complete len:300 (+) Transcript_55841:169-1068(+)
MGGEGEVVGEAGVGRGEEVRAVGQRLEEGVVLGRHEGEEDEGDGQQAVVGPRGHGHRARAPGEVVAEAGARVDGALGGLPRGGGVDEAEEVVGRGAAAQDGGQADAVGVGGVEGEDVGELVVGVEDYVRGLRGHEDGGVGRDFQDLRDGCSGGLTQGDSASKEFPAVLKWSKMASQGSMSSVRSFQSQLRARRKLHRALQNTCMEQRDIGFSTTKGLNASPHHVAGSKPQKPAQSLPRSQYVVRRLQGHADLALHRQAGRQLEYLKQGVRMHILAWTNTGGSVGLVLLAHLLSPTSLRP